MDISKVEQEDEALPEGWSVDETPGSDLPEGWTEEPEDNRSTYQQFLDWAEITPESVMKSSSQNFEKGVLSGSTFGATANIPGLKPEGVAGDLGYVGGILIPTSQLMKWFGAGAASLAGSSSIFGFELSSLANLTGAVLTGATTNAAETLAQGKMPTAEDVITHGAEWGLIDVGLQALGATGRFVRSLLSRAKSSGVPSWVTLNDTINTMRSQGVDFSQPEKVASKALAILEEANAAQEPVQGILKAAERAPGRVEELGQKTLHKGQLSAEEAAASAEPVEIGGREAGKVGEVAQNALQNQPKITPKELKSTKIEPQNAENLIKESEVLAEPYEPKPLDFTEEAENLGDQYITTEIEAVAPRAASKEELGHSIRENVEVKLNEAKEAYGPLYKEARNLAESIVHETPLTAKVIQEKLSKINKIKFKPEGYTKTERALETALEDSGYTVQKDKAGNITDIIHSGDVTVADSQELYLRLGEMVDYQALEPSVKDFIKGVRSSLKSEIKVGLAKNPDARAAFDLAEEEYKRLAPNFQRESVQKIRGMEAGERVANVANTPTALGDLKAVLGPEQYAQVERELLENLNSKTYEAAQKQLREIEKHLTPNSKQLARDIVESKNPFNPSARQKLTKQGILKDMSTALSEGSRPSKTLELWKTKKGQNIVKETFKGSPNEKAVLDYLKKQSFNDMVSSVITKKGTLDIKKFNEFMKDPGTVSNIRMLGGEEAVTFFKELEGNLQKFADNVKTKTDFLPTPRQVKSGIEYIENHKRVRTKSIAKESFREQKARGKEGKTGRGETLLERTKEKNVAGSLEKSKVGEKGVETLFPEQPGKKGKSSIAQAGEKAKEARGREILERMVRKDFPIKGKIDALREWVKGSLGLNEQAAMTVFGVAKVLTPFLGTISAGFPTTISALIGYRVLNLMATNPRVRSAFKHAISKHNNPIIAIEAWKEFGQTVEEEQEK